MSGNAGVQPVPMEQTDERQLILSAHCFFRWFGVCNRKNQLVLLIDFFFICHVPKPLHHVTKRRKIKT